MSRPKNSPSSRQFRDERELIRSASPSPQGHAAPFLRLDPDLDGRLKAFPLCVYPFPQEDMACHRHDTFMELVYVRKGRGLHLHAGAEYPIHRGDCFLVLPGDPHGYRNAVNMSIVNILFLPRILHHQIRELRTLPGFRGFFTLEPVHRTVTAFRYKLHLAPVQQEHVVTLIDRLDKELSDRGEAYRALCTALFVELVVALSRYFGAGSPAKRSSPAGEGRIDAVSEAIAFLEERYSQEVSLEELSSVAALSSSRLSHVFKESTGMSLRDYLLRMRLDKARDLLPNRSLNVTEVALACGFNDPNYFSRAFRKHTGVTPKRFRATAD